MITSDITLMISPRVSEDGDPEWDCVSPIVNVANECRSCGPSVVFESAARWWRDRRDAERGPGTKRADIRRSGRTTVRGWVMSPPERGRARPARPHRCVPSARTAPAAPPPVGPSGRPDWWSRSGSGRRGSGTRCRVRAGRGSGCGVAADLLFTAEQLTALYNATTNYSIREEDRAILGRSQRPGPADRAGLGCATHTPVHPIHHGGTHRPRSNQRHRARPHRWHDRRR